MELSVDDMLRWGWLAPGASSATWDLEGSLALNERKAQTGASSRCARRAANSPPVAGTGPDVEW